MDCDGEIWVCLKRTRESLGIAFTNQLRNHKEYPWSGVIMMIFPDEHGRPQQLTKIGRMAVSLKRLCEALGIAFKVQLCKLKEYLWSMGDRL